MDNGYVFGVATSDCIEQTELTNSKCSNDCRDSFDSSVAICGVSSVELIAVANPSKSNFGNVVECYLCR